MSILPSFLETISGKEVFLAIFGFLLLFIYKGIVYLMNYLKKNIVEGIWHGYHNSLVENKPEIEYSLWFIKSSFKYPLYAKVELKPKSGLSYEGPVTIEGRDLIANLKCVTKGHDGTAVCRLFMPVPPNNKLIYGLWLSYDYNNQIVSGPQILSRTELTDDIVDELIRNKVKLVPEKKLIRIITS